MKMRKTATAGMFAFAALGCTAALAGGERVGANAIVVSGTPAVPSAIVIVTPNVEPRPATAPSADTAGPVTPRTTPPGADARTDFLRQEKEAP